jgi:glycerol uptake facilitator-like aquaporin
MPSRTQRAVSEFLGTAFLPATVIGSGIMAQRLAGGNGALALLCNTLPTGAILTVLILIFGPVSGAHFNPAVTLAFALRGQMTWQIACAYIATQICGAVAGVWAAHIMFELPIWQFATTIRTGPMVRGGSCNIRFVADYFRLHCADARRGGLCSWAVHHSSLLVHRLDIIR